MTYIKNLIFFFDTLKSIKLSSRFQKFQLYSSPKSVIGPSSHGPHVIGCILMLHSQKKKLAVEPVVCATAKKVFGCGAFSVRHSQKKFWLWSMQCAPQPQFGCGICTDSFWNCSNRSIRLELKVLVQFNYQSQYQFNYSKFLVDTLTSPNLIIQMHHKKSVVN